MESQERQSPELQQERRDHRAGAAGYVVVRGSTGAERMVPQILRQTHLRARAEIYEVCL